MSTRLLAVDTASEACSCALWDDGSLRSRFKLAGRSHTQELMPMVQSLMAESGLQFSQLDGFVCGVGPGSFAGVRIGTGFIKGLALALDRPVVAVTSLEMMAQDKLEQGAERVAVAIDARLGEVYFGAFAKDAEGLASSLQDMAVLAPENAHLPDADRWQVCGSGWKTYGESLKQTLNINPELTDASALPDARHACRIALCRYQSAQVVDADALAPVYLRNKVALTHEEQVALRASRTRQ